MPTTRCGVLILALAAVCVSDAFGQQAAFKQIGAPPGDVQRGWLKAPNPAEHGARSRCAQLPLRFEGAALDIAFDVPHSDHVAIVPLGDGSANWSLTLTTPSGRVVREGDADAQFSIGGLSPIASQSAQRIDLSDPEAGRWSLHVEGGTPGQRGILLVRDDAPAVLRSVLGSYQLLAGEPIHFSVGLTGVESTSDLAATASDTKRRGFAIMDVIAQWHDADGRVHPVSCNRRGDLIEVMIQPPAGTHVLQIDASVFDSRTGTRAMRTVLHRIRVEADPPVLSGIVAVRPIDSHRVGLQLACENAGSRAKLLSGAEVWGLVGEKMELAGWIGGMVPVSGGVIELTLDTRWLASTGSDGGVVELRNLRLADPDSAITLTAVDTLPVGPVDVSTDSIDESARMAMRMGLADRGGVPIEPPARTGAAGGHNLMLVHGYCSSGVSWPPGQFSGDVAVYHNPEQNMSHDQFALDVMAFGNQYKSYSIAGHSQGGQAGLHLYTFYWSGLDWSTPSPADGGRVIQALGCPFYGTAIAGNLALIAEIFGVGCGENWDLTYDGSAIWVSYIPGWSRGETWSWVTTFYDGWGYDYCHLATDLFLWDPEDGVVEADSGKLSGCHFMGLKDEWCHTHDMSDPAQVDDTERNNEINAEAAR